MLELIEKLKEARPIPRRMHASYLKAHGLLDFIESRTNSSDFEGWSNNEKADYILAGEPGLKCSICSRILKLTQKYCSSKCAGIGNREFLSELQKGNAKIRAQKTRETMMKKYGVPHNNLLPHCVELRKKKRDEWCEKTRRNTFKKYGLNYDDFQDENYLKSLIESHTNIHDLCEKAFGNMPRMTVYRFLLQKGFNNFYKKSSSSGEVKLREFIKSLGFEVKESDRTIIKPLELDILVPEKKIAIEFDGIYYHSEQGSKSKEFEFNPKYHLKKTELVEEKGWQLIHIFEHEWYAKRPIVESMLRVKLGKELQKYDARKCEVRELTGAEANDFFEKTHLQGKASASVKIGLIYEDRIVAAVSFGKPRFGKTHDWELIRFSCELNSTVRGAFGKLLSHFKKNYTGTIMTYCDRRFSLGNTYSKLGTFIKKTAPGYLWCSMNGSTLSRYQTQKSKLSKMFPDKFDPSKTENDILEESGFYKLFDCGNFVFEL